MKTTNKDPELKDLENTIELAGTIEFMTKMITAYTNRLFFYNRVIKPIEIILYPIIAFAYLLLPVLFVFFHNWIYLRIFVVIGFVGIIISMIINSVSEWIAWRKKIKNKNPEAKADSENKNDPKKTLPEEFDIVCDYLFIMDTARQMTAKSGVLKLNDAILALSETYPKQYESALRYIRINMNKDTNAKPE